MKIAIDISRAVNEKAGVGRFTRELVINLVKIDKKNDYLLLANFIRHSSEKEKILRDFSSQNVKVKTSKFPGKIKEKIWQSRIPIAQKMLENADVYLAVTFLDFIWNLKIPQFVVIHDLTDFIFPEHQGINTSKYYQKLTTKACQDAFKIIAVSNSTKDDIEKFVRIHKEKIEVIFPGLNNFPAPSKNLPAGLQNNSYILFVGTIEPRKNLINLFKAYAVLPPPLQKKYPLAIVGARGWNTGETYEVLKALNLDGKVKFLGFVTDTQLATLYKNTALFVYPSKYEGFGMPILEALSFGAPVLTSNISSMPEVAGKAGVLVDPENPHQISIEMQKLLENNNNINMLKAEAKIQVEKYSWEKSARKFLTLFENVKNC